MRPKGQPAPDCILLHRQAMAMAAQGKPARVIARAIGVTRQCVNRWLRRAGQ